MERRHQKWVRTLCSCQTRDVFTAYSTKDDCRLLKIEIHAGSSEADSASRKRSAGASCGVMPVFTTCTVTPTSSIASRSNAGAEDGEQSGAAPYSVTLYYLLKSSVVPSVMTFPVLVCSGSVSHLVSPHRCGLVSLPAADLLSDAMAVIVLDA